VEEIKEFFKKLVSNLSRYNRDPPSIQPQESSVRYPSLKRKTYLPKASSRHQRNASKAFVVTRSLQIYTDRFYVDQTGEPMQVCAFQQIVFLTALPLVPTTCSEVVYPVLKPSCSLAWQTSCSSSRQLCSDF